MSGTSCRTSTCKTSAPAIDPTAVAFPFMIRQRWGPRPHHLGRPRRVFELRPRPLPDALANTAAPWESRASLPSAPVGTGPAYSRPRHRRRAVGRPRAPERRHRLGRRRHGLWFAGCAVAVVRRAPGGVNESRVAGHRLRTEASSSRMRRNPRRRCSIEESVFLPTCSRMIKPRRKQRPMKGPGRPFGQACKILRQPEKRPGFTRATRQICKELAI